MSSRVTDQQALILRRRDWRNTSLILDVFTREYGNISLLARGARSARVRADYEPFVLLSLGFSGRGELKNLNGIEGRALGVDSRNYLALLYVNELLLNFLPRDEANPEIFDAYLALLQTARQPLDETHLRRFEMELMRELGYFPDLAAEAGSGEAIRPERYYRFVIGSGFVACTPAGDDAVSGALVLAWLRQEYEDQRVRRLAKSVMRSTIDFNLHGKALKSRDVYARITQRR